MENNEPIGFREAQWRMLLATMFCYLFYYTGRQNFGWAIPGIQDSLNLTRTQIGTISGTALIFYGVGQAINGNLGDRFGARRMMTLGAVLSCALNWVTSFAHSFWTLIIPWSLNYYVQSLGWAPGSRLIVNWWGRKERGKAFGFYVFAAGFSTVITYSLAILVLNHGTWPGLFRWPVLLMLLGGGMFYLVARNRPEDLNYPPLDDEPDQSGNSTEAEVETSLDRYRHVLSNKHFLAACAGIGFQSWARYGLIFWVPVHYLGANWKETGQAWITLALPIGMALGPLAGGLLSDRIFHSNRSKPIALFLCITCAVTLAIYFIPFESRLLGVILLFLAGFFVYGPQSSFWALCPDLLGRKRAGTGVGVMNAYAYGMAAIGEFIIGRLMDHTGETGSVFLVVSVVCIAGAGCMFFVKR